MLLVLKISKFGQTDKITDVFAIPLKIGYEGVENGDEFKKKLSPQSSTGKNEFPFSNTHFLRALFIFTCFLLSFFLR
jgi:hypothetical protein